MVVTYLRTIYVSHIRTWGSPVYHCNHPELRKSVWDTRSYLGILIGIVPNIT